MESHQIVSFVIVLGILISLSACFSATETAFSTVNAIRLKNMAKEKNAKAARAYKVYKNGTATITTILIGNNIVNILATAIATSLFSSLYGEVGVAIATVVMTVLVLIFGEITPKVLAKSNPEKITLFMAPFIQGLTTLFTPVNFVVISVQNKFEKGNHDERVTATETELLEIVSTIEQEGVLEQEERELIESVIEFDDTSVHDVMVPRDDVIWIYDNANLLDIIDIMKQNKLSRFPVISHVTLKVIGVLHVRDIFDVYLDNSKNIEDIKVVEMLSEPVFISQRKKLPQALEELQKARVHMGVVIESAKVDNFVGVVTVEDMIEEIVGEIYDEHDTLPDHVIEIGLHKYEIDGEVNLTHFFDEFLEDETLPITKAKSIDQWVNELAGNKKVRKGKELAYEHIELKVLATREGLATKVEMTVYTAVEED